MIPTGKTTRVAPLRLTGKTILVTRAETQAGDLSDLIEREGGTAVMFPTIRIAEPESWSVCDAILDGLTRYDAIVFTSTNAVTAFLDRIRERFGSLDAVSRMAVYTVGEKTAARVHAYGLKVDVLPEHYTATDLAAALTPAQIAGKRFVFPHGNLGRNILADHIRANGGEIDEAIVYRTIPPEQRNVDLVRHKLQTGQIDVVTFTSPSTAKNFFLAIPDYPVGPVKPAIAVIGPVTASALEKLGHHPAVVAHSSTMEGLVESIAGYLKQS